MISDTVYVLKTKDNRYFGDWSHKRVKNIELAHLFFDYNYAYRFTNHFKYGLYFVVPVSRDLLAGVFCA